MTAVTDLINHAIEIRDQAVIAGDASGLDAVLGGELLDQDTDRIESMQSSGVRVEASCRMSRTSLLSPANPELLT